MSQTATREPRNPTVTYELRVVVTGSRDWGEHADHATVMFQALHQLRAENEVPIRLAHGGARGADAMAGQMAQRMAGTWSVQAFPAYWSCEDWRRDVGTPCVPTPGLHLGGPHGKAAGPYRNVRMLRGWEPRLVLAFHDDLPSSKGTKDCVARALELGYPVELYTYEGQADGAWRKGLA